MADVTRLEWDSDFFGVAVASARIVDDNVGAAVEAASAQGIDCLYLFITAARTEALADALRRGGRLVDLRVELDLDTVRSLPSGVRRADPAESAALRPLARSLAAESRFAADPRFAPSVVTAMYDIWLDRCFDEGLVVVPEEGFGGFVGARMVEGTTSVDLVYVDASSRGHGLAARLVGGAIAFAGATEARVATQAANIAAQRAYQSVGFRTASVQAIVHLWLDDATPRR